MKENKRKKIWDNSISKDIIIYAQIMILCILLLLFSMSLFSYAIRLVLK